MTKKSQAFIYGISLSEKYDFDIKKLHELDNHNFKTTYEVAKFLLDNCQLLHWLKEGKKEKIRLRKKFNKQIDDYQEIDELIQELENEC